MSFEFAEQKHGFYMEDRRRAIRTRYLYIKNVAKLFSCQLQVKKIIYLFLYQFHNLAKLRYN